MSFISATDGTQLYYKDWGQGRPVVFSHGWPLNSDAWDNQLKAVADAGFRGVAHDRRGHGRSDQPWNGNDIDTYADDLATVIETLDLHDAVLVGHSTGGGEVARYIGRHGTSRVSKIVLLSAIPPVMLKSESNPEGTPIEVFDEIRAGVAGDRSQYYTDLSFPFYGANREGSGISAAQRQAFWMWSMQVGVKAAYDCVHEFSESDFHADLAKVDVPALVVHGDDDQIVPIAAAALKSSQLIKDATLKVYEGAPHGVVGSRFESRFNEDLLTFIKE